MDSGNEKPRLQLFEEPVFDLDDVDGKLYMLNNDCAGCIGLTFSKMMDTAICGVVKINGSATSPGTWVSVGKVQIFGVPARSAMTEYGTEYAIHVEGFADTQGLKMDPEEFICRTLPKSQEDDSHKEDDAVALEAARESIVLLKNEARVLPLKKNARVNIFGKAQKEFRLSGSGAGRINPRYRIMLLDGIRNYSSLSINRALTDVYSHGIDVIPTDDMLRTALDFSDTAIIVLGRAAGENNDLKAAKGGYYLSDREKAMVKAVAAVFQKTIAVVNTGNPIDLSWVGDYGIKGLIYSSYLGMMGGRAIANVLDGTVNPSAKLPDTLPLDYHDVPSSRNFYSADANRPQLNGDSTVYLNTVYEEDIYVGYRYFETFNKPVAYPFGYGLSYTTFRIQKPAQKTFTDEKPASPIHFSVAVSNTGPCAGKEVVQVYSEEPDGRLEKVSRKLVAFAKTKLLAPGETQSVGISFPIDRMASYDEKSAAWILEKGLYRLWVGNSVRSVECFSSFRLKSDLVCKRVTNQMAPAVKIHTLSKKDPAETFPTGNYSGAIPELNGWKTAARRTDCQETDSAAETVPETRIKYTRLFKRPELLDPFISQLSNEELARLIVCAGSGWGMESLGEAGGLFCLPDYDMKKFIVADGNNGVNIKTKNIGMPASSAVAASFNTKLAYHVGAVIAREAKENGINLILGPGFNLHRNPLHGRYFEYFSEDPLLSGMMAGYYGKGLEDNHVSACYKHLAANNCESSRKRNQSVITERALREIYLKTFEIAFEVHQPDSVMTAYNAINGTYACESSALIRSILRGEFDFRGFVMTDWNSYDTADIVNMVKAGVSWITPGSDDDTFTKPILQAVTDGRLSRPMLKRSVWYLLQTVLNNQRNRSEDNVR